jgi:hypothetical protein
LLGTFWEPVAVAVGVDALEPELVDFVPVDDVLADVDIVPEEAAVMVMLPDDMPDDAEAAPPVNSTKGE